MRILNLLQENMASLESSLKEIILPSACKAVRRFLIILLVASQLWINFNAGRKSSTALLHISYLSWQYIT